MDKIKQQTQTPPGGSASRPVKQGNRELIGERRGKLLYAHDKPDLAVLQFRSNGADNGKKRSKGRDAAALRNEISAYLFGYLDGFRIPTHFVSKLSDSEMVVSRLDPIPLAVRIYNVANAALAGRLGLQEGTALEFPVIEHFYTTPAGAEQWVNEYHVYALRIAAPDEFKQINRIASKVNAVLRGLCDRRQLMLTELEMAFGRAGSQIVLSDEISPDTCRFIDLSAPDPSRRERFLPGRGNPEEAFVELFDRLTLKS